VTYAVETRELRRAYGRVEALCGVDLQIEPGEVFCLAGPNGAGKTTTVRIIGTQLRPGSGVVRVLGCDLPRRAPQARENLAVLPQEAHPDSDLTPWEHCYYYLCARGTAAAEARRRTETTLKRFGLWDRRDRLARTLSGGLRRRILLTMTVATGAQLMMLDEPSAGLDPVARRETWDLLADVKTDATIILTSHSMEEAGALADRLAIIYDGRIVAQGTPDELRRRLPSRQRVVLSPDKGIPPDELRRFGVLRTIAGRPVLYPESEQAMGRLIEWLREQSHPFSLERSSLEDAYVEIVEGQAAKGEGAS